MRHVIVRTLTMLMTGVKSQDQSRPVQYERAEEKGYATDIFCPMYYSPKDCEAYSKDPNYTRPLIQCEYNHTMATRVVTSKNTGI